MPLFLPSCDTDQIMISTEYIHIISNVSPPKYSITDAFPCYGDDQRFVNFFVWKLFLYNKKYDFAGNVKPKILRREKCFQISGRKIEQMSISQTPICQKQMLGLFWKLIFVFWNCGLEVPCPEILIRSAENKQQQWLDWRAKMSVINPSQELKGPKKLVIKQPKEGINYIVYIQGRRSPY